MVPSKEEILDIKQLLKGGVEDPIYLKVREEIEKENSKLKGNCGDCSKCPGKWNCIFGC